VHIVSQIQQKFQYEFLTDSGPTVPCEVLTGIEQSVDESSGYSDTEETDGTLCGTIKQWTESRREQWAQSQKTEQCKVLTGSGRNVEDSSGHRYSVSY